jgi:hypothetical protein
MADDTVFAETDALRIGIDLTNAPISFMAGIGGFGYPIRYAQVTLRMSDGIEFREWPAWVGFTTATLRRPLLGFAGCLQYFTATFFGDLEEVELHINSLYPGT